MKTGPYFVVLLLSMVCVGLTGALIWMALVNQRLQVELQARQQALNQGILGQQAQQISGGVLQDMASAAAGNAEIRRLLEKHGYRVTPSRAPASAASSTNNTQHSRSAAVKEKKETTDQTEAEKP